MAGLGFKDFQVGEVLTSANVDGYLMQQTVMRFADSGARGSALGTATGTAVPLAEGMVTYLDDTNTVEVYTGTVWRGIGGFDSVATIAATDATWSVPSLSDPIVKVTVVGGGGGGGAGFSNSTAGANGNASSFACSAGTATASGGLGGAAGNSSVAGRDATDGFVSYNGGDGGNANTDPQLDGRSGTGGSVTVAYLNLDGVSTANVTVGAGGAGNNGGDGGDGVVIVEYRAG